MCPPQFTLQLHYTAAGCTIHDGVHAATSCRIIPAVATFENNERGFLQINAANFSSTRTPIPASISSAVNARRTDARIAGSYRSVYACSNDFAVSDTSMGKNKKSQSNSVISKIYSRVSVKKKWRNRMRILLPFYFFIRTAFDFGLFSAPI